LWSPYDKESNSAIEEEFQRNRNGNISVYIGCRSFKIDINGIYGTQTDILHGLKRAIQRKMIKKTDYVEPTMDDGDDDDDVETCFCMEPTSLYDTIALPCCKNIVHKVCIKPLVNQQKPCPYCRVITQNDVWESILGEQVGVHYSGR
jgi:hypothetical protein